MSTRSGLLGRNQESRKSQVLYQLWKEGPISRGALADLMGLNLPTVSAIVQDLLKTEELIEEGFATSTGGRKAQLLDVNPVKGGIVAIEFSNRGILSASSDMKGRLQNHVIRPWSHRATKDETIEAIKEAVQDQKNFLKEDEKLDLARIGVVVSGLVDEVNGVSKTFPRMDDWKDVDLAYILKKAFKVPVDLSSHVVGTTLAESIFGRFKEIKNFVYVHLGPGLAIGIVVDGIVYRGVKTTVGEIGHMTVVEDGPLCYCGNYGCLETVASDWALVAQAKKAIDDGVQTHIPEHADETGRITPAAIFSAAETGDRFASSLIDRAGHYIGISLASVVNLLAPEAIIFGGSMSDDGDKLIKAALHTVKLRALEDLERDIKIDLGSFGLQAGVFGAVAIALHKHYGSFTD
jgi:predicted NBD/HSP70 family sugar kinase